jgi:hypothetical protein
MAAALANVPHTVEHSISVLVGLMADELRVSVRDSAWLSSLRRRVSVKRFVVGRRSDRSCAFVFERTLGNKLMISDMLGCFLIPINTDASYAIARGHNHFGFVDRRSLP